MPEIERRKEEHIDVVRAGGSGPGIGTTGLEHIRFLHNALPELDIRTIDLSCRFLSRTLSAPLLVSSMTGGPERAGAMNLHIAEACNSLGLAFGVGSQRIALEGGAASGFGRDLRRAAPDVPLLANFGAAQLKGWDGVEMARRAIGMIEADALIIHLNPLQEAVQPGGDTDWSGLAKAIEGLCKACDFPIVVKEVGAGISGPVARRLVEAGVAVIDVAGAGGTSWAAVEAARAETRRDRAVAAAFRDWGIPTADAIVAVRMACPSTPIVASGGIRDGLDAARAIRLGADVVGIAAGVLEAAISGAEALADQLATYVDQLRVACFCTGSADLAALRSAPLLSPPAPIATKEYDR